MLTPFVAYLPRSEPWEGIRWSAAIAVAANIAICVFFPLIRLRPTCTSRAEKCIIMQCFFSAVRQCEGLCRLLPNKTDDICNHLITVITFVLTICHFLDLSLQT